MIAKEEVIHIAELARLELTPEEVEKMQKDLSAILDYFEILKKVDTQDIKKSESKVKREQARRDEVKDKSPDLVGDLIKAFPEQKDGYIKVKQIF